MFDLGRYAIDPSISRNAENTQILDDILKRVESDSLFSIISIKVDSYASPEGDSYYNKNLSRLRSESIVAYLRERSSISDSLITINSHGSAWGQLRAMVADSDMANRDQVLHIIDNVPEERWGRVEPSDKWLSLVDSRNKRLMDLRGGVPYIYMQQNFFAQLRLSSVVTICYREEQIVESEPIKDEESDPIVEDEPIKEEEAEEKPIAEAVAAEPTEPTESAEPISRPLLAVKTNLLFDALSLVNVEVEVPIGQRWSVAGEWIFPWWTWDDGTSASKRNRTQLLNGNISGKYWFGDRTDRDVMTGLYAGFYAGGGLYDLERNAKGYQGEFFIAAGVDAGYAHTINRCGSLRMEYSFGIGYLNTNYRYYEALYDIDSQWHPVHLKDGRYTWIGPTRARVSLVWLISRKVSKGGVR